MSKSKSKQDLLASLLQGKRSEVKDYYDLVNRTSPMDDIGDAFLEQSKQPALNGKQRLANAMKAGFGGGLKSGASSVRDAKLAEIESYTKEAAINNAQMQIQIGQAEQKKLAFANYTTDNYADLKKWNMALEQGDEKTSNQLGMLLYNRFKQGNPDLGERMPEIDHIYNGKAYFDKDGQTEGIFIKDLMAPLVSTLPEEYQRELPQLNTLTMRNKFEKSDLFDDLSIQDKRASIASKNAQAEQYKAHANLYNQEAIQTPLSNGEDKAVLRDRAKKNYALLEKQVFPRMNANQKVYAVYENLEKIVKEHPDITGASWFKQGKRAIVQGLGLDSSVAIDLVNLDFIEFEKQLRPLLGAQFGQQEGERILNRFANLNKNANSLREYLPKEIEKLKQEVARDKNIVSEYHKNNSVNIFSPDFYDNEEVNLLDQNAFSNMNMFERK